MQFCGRKAQMSGHAKQRLPGAGACGRRQSFALQLPVNASSFMISVNATEKGGNLPSTDASSM